MLYNRRSISVKTPAASQPVTLSDVKTFLRVDGSADDALLTGFIEAATDAAQKYCNRYFINTVLELRMDGFPSQPAPASMSIGDYREGHVGSLRGYGDEFDLPYRPIVSVTSIKTYNEDNTETTVSALAYRLDGKGGRVYLNDGYTWPSSLRAREAVLVEYTAGYGSNAAAVPAAIKTAIMMYVGQLYECRTGCDMSAACKAMLDGYRLLDRLGWQ